MRRTRRGATVVGALLALTLLGGCGGGGSGESSSGSAAGAQDRSVQAPNEAKGAAGSPLSSGDTGATADTGASGRDTAASGGDQGAASGGAAALEQRREIKTAQMQVRTKDVTAAGIKVRRTVQALKGFVSDETTSTGEGYGESQLTLRVPSSSLDVAMDQVASTGTLLSRSQSTEDVTATYVDTASRVRTQTASVDRVRALLSKATDLGQVVQIEGELSRRQADLESLQARLKQLEDDTALSTLVVSLVPLDRALPKDDQDDDGFLGGLSAGWTALTASLTVALTIVGALVPFLLIAAVVVVPVVLLGRRRARTRPQGPSGPLVQPTVPGPPSA